MPRIEEDRLALVGARLGEAVLDPAAWPDLMEEICKEVGAVGSALLQSDVPGYPCRRGKVRDVYDLGDRLILIATDRLSAFDWVLPSGIPDKGRILTALTRFWFNFLKVPNHFVSDDLALMSQQQRHTGNCVIVDRLA